MLQVKQIGKGAFHVTTQNDSNISLLTKYGFLQDKVDSATEESTMQVTPCGVTLLSNEFTLPINVANSNNKGFKLDIALQQDERLFGLGDANRDDVMIRGKVINLWVANVASYGPMPVLLSSKGWAIVVNSTYCQKFDLGYTNPDVLTIISAGGSADFYLIKAQSMLQLVQAVTDITGKPTMLPAFGYGLTFVESDISTNAKEMLNDIRTMRDRDIPCDVFGLEPSWMDFYYDYSTQKTWNKSKFALPSWLPENTASHRAFLGPMRFMGMKLSLWLCNDYDLLYEEERQAKANQTTQEQQNDDQFAKNVDFVDHHLVSVSLTDKVTKEDEPWFEHLKKFVDNGASCFKLDGANQVQPHPQRLWAKKYLDDQVHNVYPLIYAKQMQQGFANYTDRRALIYTSGAYLGTQKYAATWAGDTGGGRRTLVACLNYAMCGHTNTTCDMDVMDPLAIHYAFLSTWTQLCSWGYYFYPWFLPTEIEKTIQTYSKLRSTLFPYIYSMAHKASLTGIPVMRPLPMVYNDTNRFDDVSNAYMFGDSLYVGAFDMNLKLPQGNWVDYFTGKVYSGNISYDIPQGYSGALLAKQGAVVGTMVSQQYILEKEHDYVIKVFLGGNGSFDLYEDDNYTYDYLQGQYATTHFENSFDGTNSTLTVCRRQGSYSGRPNNGHDLINNSIPQIDAIKQPRDIVVELIGNVSKVTCQGKDVPTTPTQMGVKFVVTASEHIANDLQYTIIGK